MSFGLDHHNKILVILSSLDIARHHPPPRKIAVEESRRVGGRVHAVVSCGAP